MIVELLIFSGRPNPVWRASPEERAEILRRIACESPVPARASENALGYAGFSIRDSGKHKGATRAREIHVCDGVVAIAAADGIRYCADLAGLERYLLEMGRTRKVLPVGFETL